MVAERRDLIVATYSSVCGTCARSIVFVLTGMAFGGGCFASVLLQPEFERTAKLNNKIGRIAMIRFTVDLPKKLMPYRCLTSIRRCRSCLQFGTQSSCEGTISLVSM